MRFQRIRYANRSASWVSLLVSFREEFSRKFFETAPKDRVSRRESFQIVDNQFRNTHRKIHSPNVFAYRENVEISLNLYRIVFNLIDGEREKGTGFLNR